MKAKFFFLVWFFAAVGSLKADPFIRIVEPYENANLPFVKQTFVFGSVLPTSATVTINGVAIKPYSNGGFLAMIPVQPGKFKFEAVASDGFSTATVTRLINVQEPARSYPADYKKIDPIAPRTRLVVRPGDTVDLSFQAAPGGKAEFRLRKNGESFSMEEQAGAVAGLYRGIYIVKPGDAFEHADVLFQLRRKDGKRITAKAGADITVQRRRTPRLVELKEDAILLTGPDSEYGYNLFALQGTRLEVTGESGDFLRVAVSESNQGWIKRPLAIDLPPGALPAKSVSRNFKIEANDKSTLLYIPLQYRHPHRVEQFVNPYHMRLTLYGVIADSDRIDYKSSDSIIKEVTWFQSEPQTCVIDIQTKQDQPWGYDLRYEGNTLVVELRHRPSVNGKSGSLKGLKIAIDAGHSKESYGTIGPWGNTEASVNLATAKVVQQELETRGAEVVMIQDGTKEISLQQRTDLAWKERAQLYISIHADACGEGQDPREVQGYSVHYYHPQSHALAEAVHTIYGQKSGVRDAGLWRSNLAVCRMTQMPSILMEQAFLILPEYEEMMLTARHEKNVADAIITAVLQLFEEHPK